MQEFFLTIWNRPDFWSYVAIPFIAAAVGWFTNWIAIQMTFWPLEFVGYKKLRLGWQGIIPSKAEKMAGMRCGFTRIRRSVQRCMWLY